jgi:hypothetical protein|tara:strand:+ start:329 stop:733 length:405 start_codon:yes stop_codon:yes gene_type:complete
MISWNKKRTTFLIIGSGVWIFFLIVLSIYLYPEKRNNPKLEKKEWIDLLRKENKNHEENIAVLKTLKEQKSFNVDKSEIKILIEKSITSLGSSILQHQREYNEKKERSLKLLFYGLGILVGTWGLLYFFSEKKG